MSEESAPVAEVQTYALPADAPAEMSVSDAARMLSQARRQAQEPPAERAPKATTEEPELAVEADAEPEEVPGETEEVEAVDPPIDRPKSWSKDEDAEWQSLPRAMQQKIVARELERDTGTTRSQQKAADAEKAAEAKAAQAEQARQQYEARLPELMQALYNTNNTSFGDIKTQDDADRLGAEDPFRWIQWKAHQDRMAATRAELQLAHGKQTQEKQSKRASYETEQNKRLIELVPEMADPKKASGLRERAVAMLTDDLGLKTDQLGKWMADDTGHEILSNAGIQKLIADGLKYRDILKAPKAVSTKPLPPVQKPGVAKGTTQPSALRIQTIQSQLTTATGNNAIKLAAELTRLKRAR